MIAEYEAFKRNLPFSVKAKIVEIVIAKLIENSALEKA